MSILITALLINVWILKGEVTCESLLGVKGLKQSQAYSQQHLKQTE